MRYQDCSTKAVRTPKKLASSGQFNATWNFSCMKLAALIPMKVPTTVTKQDTSEYPAVTKKKKSTYSLHHS